MRRRLAALAPLLWIVAVALFGARVTGAHVHLCLDGHEPRSSIRISDTDSVCQTAADGESHQDQDVDDVAAVLAKHAGNDDALTPLLAAYVSTLQPPPVRLAAEPASDAAPPQRPQVSLPLQRGPPA